MYYVYHIMEKTYSGKYGIDDWILREQVSLEDAKKYGFEASKGLMHKYNSIDSSMRSETVKQAKKEGIEIGSIDYYVMLEEAYNNNVLYELFEVEVGNTDMMYLYQLFNRNKLQFISEYCKQIV